MKKKKESPRPPKRSRTELADDQVQRVANIIPKKRGEVKIEKMADDHPLLAGIYAHYVETWKRGHSGDKLPRAKFYNSDIGNCPRQTAYQFYCPEKKRDISVSTIMLFKYGDLFHDELQGVIKKLGFSTSKDIEFGTWSNLGFERRGRIDVLYLEEDGKMVLMVVVEIKSKNPYGFQTPPEDNEIDQTLSYVDDCLNSAYFKERGQAVADYFYILYVERSGLVSPPLALWKGYYSVDRVKAIKLQYRRLYKCIQAHLLPERPYERDAVKCQYCRMQDWCWMGVPSIPPPPELVPDETIKPASYEIVQSQAQNYVRIKGEIGALEKELGLSAKVMEQYFKSTGKTKIEELIEYEGYQRPDGVDEEFLWKKLKDVWNKISDVSITKLRDAVKDGLIDGETFERARRFKPAFRIKIIKPKKEAKNASNL